MWELEGCISEMLGNSQIYHVFGEKTIIDNISVDEQR